MGLFGFKKRMEEEATSGCCCGSSSGTEPVCNCDGAVSGEQASVPTAGCCACGETGCNIKVLGAGCKACHEQYENVKKAVANRNLNAEVEYITDMEKVTSYGVMSMPAIVVNEQVVSAGKVLKAAQVEELLKKLGC